MAAATIQSKLFYFTLSLPQMCAISGLLLSLPDAVAPTSLLFGVRFSFSSAAGFCH